MIKGIEQIYNWAEYAIESFNDWGTSIELKNLFNDLLKIDKNNDNEIISQIEKICSELKKDRGFYYKSWNSVLERIKGDNNSHLYAAVCFVGNENHTLGLFSKKEDAINCIKTEVSFKFTKEEYDFLYDDCVSFFNKYDDGFEELVAKVYKVRLNINESNYYAILGAMD